VGKGKRGDIYLEVRKRRRHIFLNETSDCALITRLYMRVGILLTHGKHLHDCIISLRRVVKALKIRLTPPFPP
jgi:hypothetical protein